MFAAVGCDDDYFTDGGVLDENVGILGVSTLDYLKNEGAKYDTLVALIEMSNLETSVNATGNTFMIPQDFSIYNYLLLKLADLDSPPEKLADLPEDIKTDIKEILRNYIIPGKEILREELSLTYSFETTLGGQKARYNILRSDYLGNVNKGAEYINFSLDIDPDPKNEVFMSVRVVTSNLKSTNGVVHVLQSDSHTFGFN